MAQLVGLLTQTNGDWPLVPVLPGVVIEIRGATESHVRKALRDFRSFIIKRKISVKFSLKSNWTTRHCWMMYLQVFHLRGHEMKDSSLRLAKSQWNKWLQAFLPLFTEQSTNQNPTRMSQLVQDQHSLQHKNSADTLIYSLHVFSSISVNAPHRPNKVLIHCLLALSLCLEHLQKFTWPGRGHRAKGGRNSPLNRWHTPFLSLPFPQSLHPGATGSPKSVPIKTPVRWAQRGRGLQRVKCV